jgi:hypothetical protein
LCVDPGLVGWMDPGVPVAICTLTVVTMQ